MWPPPPRATLPLSFPTCPRSYCEIYNEEITDLLAPASSGLQIRDGDPHRGVYVEDLSEHVAVNGGSWAAGGRWLGLCRLVVVG